MTMDDVAGTSEFGYCWTKSQSKPTKTLDTNEKDTFWTLNIK
jgi:hypothetical protein